MKNNKNVIWIVLIIVGIYFFMNQDVKKNALVPLSGGDFDVYIGDYSTESGYLNANIDVTNRLTTKGSMYVEFGVYAIEDNQWLKNYLESNKKTGIDDPKPTLTTNCVDTETNVQTYRFDLDGKSTLGFWYGKESKQFKVVLPPLDISKTYYMFAQAFKQCASSGGDLGISDYSLIRYTTSSPGGDDVIITGLPEEDLYTMSGKIIAEHTCTDTNSVCEASARCSNLKYLEDKGSITSAQGDVILDEGKSFWQGLIDLMPGYTWIKDIFDNEDKSKAGICVIKSEGFCVISISKFMQNFGLSNSCQTNTIIFFAAILFIFMMFMMMSKR